MVTRGSAARGLELTINGELVALEPVNPKDLGRTYFNPAQEKAVTEKSYHADVTILERVLYAREARVLMRTYRGGMEDLITLTDLHRKALEAQVRPDFSPFDFTAYANFRKIYQALHSEG